MTTEILLPDEMMDVIADETNIIKRKELKLPKSVDRKRVMKN